MGNDAPARKEVYQESIAFRLDGPRHHQDARLS